MIVTGSILSSKTLLTLCSLSSLQGVEELGNVGGSHHQDAFHH